MRTRFKVFYKTHQGQLEAALNSWISGDDEMIVVRGITQSNDEYDNLIFTVWYEDYRGEPSKAVFAKEKP